MALPSIVKELKKDLEKGKFPKRWSRKDGFIDQICDDALELIRIIEDQERFNATLD